MKEFHSGAIALFLLFIALNITVQTFQPSTKVEFQTTAPVEQMRIEVLPVVTKANTDYDIMGLGSTGFVVKEGAGLTFIKFDEGSRLGMIETPQFLIRLTCGEDKVIQPLFIPTAEK